MCLHDSLSYVPFNLICSMTTFKKCFDLLIQPRVEVVCKDRICVCMVFYAPFPLIWYATGLLPEKNLLTFWPHTRDRGYVYGQNICYHGASCVIPFNLICNMTIFWKGLILASSPPPKSTQGVPTQAFELKKLFDMFRILCTSVCMRFGKILTTDLNLNIWPLTLPKG